MFMHFWIHSLFIHSLESHFALLSAGGTERSIPDEILGLLEPTFYWRSQTTNKETKELQKRGLRRDNGCHSGREYQERCTSGDRTSLPGLRHAPHVLRQPTWCGSIRGRTAGLSMAPTCPEMPTLKYLGSTQNESVENSSNHQMKISRRKLHFLWTLSKTQRSPLRGVCQLMQHIQF